VRWPSPTAGGLWSRLLWRFVPAMALLLSPWPGLARAFSVAFGGACNALVQLAANGDGQVDFVASRYEPDHPWWVLMSVKNVFTAESFGVPVDTRTVAYLRMSTFISLALTWPLWKTRRQMMALAFGIALLSLSIAVSVALPLLQVLGMVHVLALGVAVQSILSVGILMLVTYPSMAFAVPGLIWWLTLRVAANPADARFPAAQRATAGPAAGAGGSGT
jgi:hypothetical protein